MINKQKAIDQYGHTPEQYAYESEWDDRQEALLDLPNWGFLNLIPEDKTKKIQMEIIDILSDEYDPKELFGIGWEVLDLLPKDLLGAYKKEIVHKILEEGWDR